jgi:N-acetylated-alpha-linked acidic dipeptidase
MKDPACQGTREKAFFLFLLLSVAIGLATAGACSRPAAVPFGFAQKSGRAHLALEGRFLSLPDAARIRDAHRLLTLRPHPAGSERDRELASWTAQQFRAAGLQDVQITNHEVLLPWPEDISVELVAPVAWRASMREPPLFGDPDTAIAGPVASLPHHAYSATGDVTAPVVNAGRGEPADYEWLARQGIGVRGRIVIVRHDGARRYRGAAVWTAQQQGAVGILMYPDPRDASSAGGQPSPSAWTGPESRIERGSVAYDFLVPGDPLTPGWPSLPGAKRVDRSDAVSLPKILSVPLSANDARSILQALGGPALPESLRSGLVSDLRAGPGPGVVRMKIRMDEKIRSVSTVTGMLRGASPRGDVVIIGNHRDAWVYGGVDPSTGSAALVELARAFGALAQAGWQPKRSVMFASWDAEELALISSTEWGEQHAAWLSDRAVAYLNVDSAASGSRFVAGAVPSLMRVVLEAAEAVRDPVGRTSIAAAARARYAADRGVSPRGTTDEVVEDRLGGGSDYTVFLNHLGVPAADLAFDGPYQVYHSVYDTHRYVMGFADPEFRYTTTLVKVLGIVAMRLMEGDAIPLDVEATAARIARFVGEMEGQVVAIAGTDSLADVRAAVRELELSAAAFTTRRDAAVTAGDAGRLAVLNGQAMALERAFTDPPGLRERPWYRHLIHAPDRTYAPLVLPGIAEAIASGDRTRVAEEAARVAQALRRAAGVLR